MHARTVVTGLVVAAATALAGAPPSLAATRCVGKAHDCYRTVQAALEAAHDGDAIAIGSGTFAGPITIAKSVIITGAGARSTVLRGGGPVVTIGTLGTATEPTVSIADVTIRGGRTTSGPAGEFGPGDAQATGGGVFVPPAANFAAGATLAIRNSVITDNRVAPKTTLGPDPRQTDWPQCPDGPCPFAGAQGGGIYAWGDLTLTDTVVSDNTAGGPLASDASGAGIWSNIGTLTLVRSKVVRNRAAVVAPNGRFAEGGGMLVQGGALVMRDSVVADNATSLASDFPSFVGDKQLEMTSQAGGALVAGTAPATIAGSAFTHNASTAHDPAGEPAAYDAGLLVLDGPLTMRDSIVNRNRAASETHTTEDIGPAGAALEAHGGGTLTSVRVVDNTSDIDVSTGVASASGAVNVFNFDGDPQLLRFVDSVIAGNRAIASSESGSAEVRGAGVYNNSLLALHGTVVAHNTGVADGPSGAAEGGGIWNGVAVSGPPVELTLVDSAVNSNALRARVGIARRGGGLFTTEPVTRTRTRISGNAPDQCFGCG